MKLLFFILIFCYFFVNTYSISESGITSPIMWGIPSIPGSISPKSSHVPPDTDSEPKRYSLVMNTTLIYIEPRSDFIMSRFFIIKDDDEMILQLLYLKDNMTKCLEPSIDLRHIKITERKVEAVKVNFQIPEHNFCPGPSGFYPIDLYVILPDLFFIPYVNSMDSNSSYYGLMFDRKGVIISNNYLPPVPIKNGNIYPYSTTRTHMPINEETDFIFAYLEPETKISWINHKM